ncbi:integrase catalytic subunit [Burkholderia lata]|nr:integrase catalytic subunit [Burkholderia lata]
MYFGEKGPLGEITRRPNLSRNTVRAWLHPKLTSPCVLDDWGNER